jgi:hypothetical protein
MPRIIFDKKCPRCSSHRLRRIERKKWMRYLPKSKYYQCQKCRTHMLVLYDRVCLKVG